ncbi:Uncharacterized protein Fot_37879 [Forsythia ovata]|uniref:Uncharacterized protein n=1 Tax=Forsythia ovata TaxID=205694 RepID=A0ABD1S2R9_9LAMI
MKIISLDTPTPTKDSIDEKNRNAHIEGSHRRMGSFSSKESHKNESVEKPILEKIDQPQVYKTQKLNMMKNFTFEGMPRFLQTTIHPPTVAQATTISGDSRTGKRKPSTFDV